MLRCCTLALSLLLAQGPAKAETPDVRQAPVVTEGALHGIGELVADVAFVDLDGKEGKLSDDRGKPIVVMLGTVSCPLSRKFAPKLARLAAEWAERGMVVLLVNPAEDETHEEMRKAYADWGFECRIVPDPSRSLSRALGALVTTDAFVLDGARTLRYRGSVDDQYGFGYARASARHNYLADAVDAVLSNRTPLVAATTGPGCGIDYDEASPVAVPLTYHARISRILQRACVDCHRPGEAGPFPLQTFEEVKAKRGSIRVAVGERFMPPWFATAGGPWRNAHRLSEDERADLLAWIEAGCPEGDAADAPLPLEFAEGWNIGEPDVVLEIPRTYQIPAEGVVDYRYCKVRTNFAEDRWVEAIEIRPTAPENVHHVLVFLEFPRDHPRASEQRQYRGGIRGYFAGMVPGANNQFFPEGTARFLPRGATLHFQLHYTTNGREAEDRTRIAFQFADGPPEREIITRAAANRSFEIPPGDANHKVTATITLRKAGAIWGFNPHMHLRGKAFRYELVYPDGREELVLDVPAYDFNWQLFYDLRHPIAVPARTKVRATAWFDNSASNPANPDPKDWVYFGEQTFEEMMIGYFTFTEGDLPPSYEALEHEKPQPRQKAEPERDEVPDYF